MEPRKFRRPAILSPSDAEQVTDSADIEENSDMAHATAWAMMGIPSEEFNTEVVHRLVTTVRANGADIVAPLWDNSPAFTLPGALWRLYLLWQWNQLNPGVVADRFAEGQRVYQEAGDATMGDVSLAETLEAVKGTLAGFASEDDLAPTLEATAKTLRVMAAGLEHGPRWITSDSDELAHPVTRRPAALLDTAEELEEGALRARHNNLE